MNILPKKSDSSAAGIVESTKEAAIATKDKVSTAGADAVHATSGYVEQAKDYVSKTAASTTAEKPSGGGSGEYVQKAKDFASNPLGK